MKKAILFFLLSCNAIIAQDIKLPSNIASPTASSLGRYGDVPVSLHTGHTNIVIPIHSMNVLGVPLDISLSYDSSGVRVNSVPGWVGQNWALNCGGVITRQVNGENDEYSNSEFNSFSQSRGYMYPECHGLLNVPNWDDLEYLKTVDGLSVQGNLSPINRDTQPDIFTFNFMGKTGKFFMGEDGEWKVASESNLKVKILQSDFIYPLGQQYVNSTGIGQTKGIGRIELTDDMGVTYIFGSEYGNPVPGSTAPIPAIEYSKSFFGQLEDDWAAMAWYLIKVVSAEGKWLYRFDYERNTGYSAEFYNYQYYRRLTYYFSNGAIYGPNGCSDEQYSTVLGNGINAIGGSLISDVYLKKITTLDNEIIKFESDNYFWGNYKDTSTILANYITNFLNAYTNPQDAINILWHMRPYTYNNQVTPAIQILDKIKFRHLLEIKRPNGEILAAFNYNQPPYTNFHNQRLNLMGLSLGPNQNYTFEYDRLNEVPPYLSKMDDHLGYYNGVQYPIGNSSNYSSFYNFKNTDVDKVKIGSLNKIIYPTKGFSEFEYEANSYSRYVADDKSAIISVANTNIGGIRIHRVLTNDNNGNVTTKEYKYVKNYIQNNNGTTSSGIISNLPKYYWPNWLSLPQFFVNMQGDLTVETFSTNPIIPLGNFFGSAITYDEVTEINDDGSYTNYKYTNHDDYKDEVNLATFQQQVSPYDNFNDRSLLRGKLKEKTIFNSNNIMVSQSKYDYSTNGGLSIKFVKGTNVYTGNCGVNTAGYGILRGNAYKIYYFDNDLIKEENISFFNGNQVKEETTFEYLFYPNLNTSMGDRFLKGMNKQVYLANAQNNNVRNQLSYKYPFDNQSPINTELLQKRMFPILISEERKNNTLISTKKVEYGHFYTYNYATNFTTVVDDYLLPSKTLMGKGNGLLNEEIIIDAYDRYGKVCEYHDLNGKYTTLVYSYYGKYLVAKLEGPYINPNDFQLLSYYISGLVGQNGDSSYYSNWLTNHTQIKSFLTSMRSNYSNHFVTTYTYKPFNGVYSLTDPKGYTTNFDYDANNRLQYVKDADMKILSQTNYHYKN